MKRKKKNGAVDESVRVMQVFGDSLKFKEKLPANVRWHICLTTPTPGRPNHPGKCRVCGVQVFYSDEVKAEKMCPACCIKLNKDKKIETVMTREQFDGLHGFINRN